MEQFIQHWACGQQITFICLKEGKDSWQGSLRGLSAMFEWGRGWNRLNREEPRGSIPGLRVRSIAQLKYIYTSAHNMGNRQEYLEAIVQQENYDFVGSWCGRRPAWLNRELSLRLQEKKKVYHLWKKGQATCENTMMLLGYAVRKIRMEKAQIEFNLAAVVKHNKKGFYKYIKKRRAKENFHPLLDAVGEHCYQEWGKLWGIQYVLGFCLEKSGQY